MSTTTISIFIAEADAQRGSNTCRRSHPAGNSRDRNHLRAVWFQSPRHCPWFLLHSPAPSPAGPQASFCSACCQKNRRTSLEGHLPEKGHYNVTAQPGSEARLPKARPPALCQLLSFGSVSLGLAFSTTSILDHPSTHPGKSGMEPKEEAEAPTSGKEDRGEWRCFPDLPTWWSGGIISGVSLPFLQPWAHALTGH